jgi:hypothetical protein
MTKINDLFVNSYEKGRDVQIRTHLGEEVDGRAVWQKLEEPIKDINIEELQYNESLNHIYEKIDKVDKEFLMSENELNPKSNHFLLQLRNLVKSKSNFIIKINRILQLGFNAGQLSIFIEKNTLPEDRSEKIAKLFYKYKLNELETYVSLDKQEIIDKQLPQLGGQNLNYKQKYLKYKNKYLKLKLLGGNKCTKCGSDWIYVSKRGHSLCESCYKEQNAIVHEYHRIQNLAFEDLKQNDRKNAIIKLQKVIELRNKLEKEYFSERDKSHDRLEMSHEKFAN